MFLNCRRTFVFVRHLHSLRAVNLAQPDQHFFIFIYLKNNYAQKQLPPLVFGTHFSFHFLQIPNTDRVSNCPFNFMERVCVGGTRSTQKAEAWEIGCRPGPFDIVV